MKSTIPAQSISIWHKGEVAIQRTVGVAEQMAAVGKQVIRSHLLDQHRTFFSQLPFIVVGSVDPAGNVWATLLAGKPGFLHSPDPSTLRIETTAYPSDPAKLGLDDGDAIGLLGIDLRTRRRNRLNGEIRRVSASIFDVTVAQSYGNCPQYIRERDFSFIRDPANMEEGVAARSLSITDSQAVETISKADTFFIASCVDREDDKRQVDVSHKAGKPGFVRIGNDGVLTIPDFAGNLYFNTLGNILVNPRCGLVFVDFATGDVLQLSGRGEVILESPEIAAFQGAERLLKITPDQILFRPGGLPLRWSSDPEGMSYNSLMTGSWDEAAARLKAQEVGAAWRSFGIAKIVEETASIRSFYLQPTDGGGLMPYQAGQYIPIRVKLPSAKLPVVRNFTLSSASFDGFYRISVKREGEISSFLHALAVGDIIEARGPLGEFIIDAHAANPVVLISAGIGVTPMLSMLRQIIYEGKRTRSIRPTWFIYAARSKRERGFDRELATLLSLSGKSVVLTRVLSNVSSASETDYELEGRIDIKLLRAGLPFEGYDFYICGPTTFTQDVYDALRELEVADDSIHAEAFGPASLKRQRGDRGPVAPLPREAQGPVGVTFRRAGKWAEWTSSSGYLLDLAESLGLDPASSCRAGWCGACRAKILSGEVTYKAAPTAEVRQGEALVCCAVPAISAQSGGLILEL